MLYDRTLWRYKYHPKQKNASENPLAPTNANGNPQLYATLPPGFWKTEAKMASTCTTKVRVKIPTKVC